MGLCKCRVVTTLFCFQCRVNVCEACMVRDHKTCIVRTYIQWLSDSDFDPTCRLCGDMLLNGMETIRLPCLDVLHFKCLNAFAETLPAHTAPAGYQCPICTTPVVPDPRNTGAVATAARRLLATVRWAGLSTGATTQHFPGQLPSQTPALPASVPEYPGAGPALTAAPSSNPPLTTPQAVAADVAAAMHTAVTLPSVLASSLPSLTATSPPPPRPTGSRKLATGTNEAVVDADDDKYARRPVSDRIAQTLRNHIGRGGREDDDAGTQLKKTAVLLLVCIIIAITLLELMSRVRPNGRHDELLDPHMNPNVRVIAE